MDSLQLCGTSMGPITMSRMTAQGALIGRINGTLTTRPTASWIDSIPVRSRNTGPFCFHLPLAKTEASTYSGHMTIHIRRGWRCRHSIRIGYGRLGRTAESATCRLLQTMGPFYLETVRTIAPLSVTIKVLLGLFHLRVRRNGRMNFRPHLFFRHVTLAVAPVSLRNLPLVVNRRLPWTGPRTGWVMVFTRSGATALCDGHLILARTSILFASLTMAQFTRSAMAVCLHLRRMVNRNGNTRLRSQNIFMVILPSVQTEPFI